MICSQHIAKDILQYVRVLTNLKRKTNIPTEKIGKGYEQATNCRVGGGR
jgi:hypothetical protein